MPTRRLGRGAATASAALALALALALLLLLPAPIESTAPALCGAECGPLFSDYPHNDSCWRPDTQSYFSFDLQPHFHVSDRCFGENDPCEPLQLPSPGL